jgi:Mycobacterium membrane protein
MVERGVREFAQTRSDVADTGPLDVSPGPGPRRTFLGRVRQPPPVPRARSLNTRRTRGLAISRVLMRLWVPLVILAVVVTGGFVVSRLHGVFGSEKQLSYSDTRGQADKPYNPKHLRYEVFGPPGTVAEIAYFDVNGDPKRLKGAPLPWSLEFGITAASAVGNVIAQGDSDSIGCRILIDNVVKTEKITHEVSAFAFCLLKDA